MSKSESNVQTPDAVVGKPLDRVDGKLKVTGAARYAAEFTAPNLAYAALLQSTIAKGSITKFDTSAAERAPGVIAVITADNMPAIPAIPAPGGVHALGLFDKQIFFSGQHIGVVVAETLEQAQHATNLVQIDYASEKSSVIMDAELDHAIGLGRNPRAVVKRGDVDAALAQAAVKIEAT